MFIGHFALGFGAAVLPASADQRTFEVTLQTSLNLAASIPTGTIKVSESGIFARSDVEALRAAGYDSFLVGEHLMKAADPVAALRALTDTPTPQPGN